MGLGRQSALIIGSGGREHTIGYKLLESYEIQRVYHAPGNGGTAENIGISAADTKNLIRFARSNNCLTVVGPEAPLACGIVDAFREEGLPIIGPTREAARLEWSKVFAKEFMLRNGILTPSFEVFGNPDEAKAYVKSRSGIVVKRDGLAQGKGVEVCDTGRDAIGAIDKMTVDRASGATAERILVEERLLGGEEATYTVLTDGKSYMPLATSQDHKRAGNGDTGNMTGGMGACSPTPLITPELEERIKKRIVEPTIRGMASDGIPFTGFLYLGLMIMPTRDVPEPHLLEYNARLGDPEAQAMLFRLESDLFPYLDAAANGRLDRFLEMSWSPKSSVTVVMAAKGYPKADGKYAKDEEIRGTEPTDQDSFVFHSGTKKKNGRILTDGRGRVLSVTALGGTLEEAAANAYRRVKGITGPELHCRDDIAKKGIEMLRREGKPAPLAEPSKP